MSPPEQPNRIDVWEYLAVVRRNLPLVLGVTAVVVISALALTRLQDPVYTGKGRLLVEQRASIFGNADNATGSEFVQTEIQFLESEAVRSLVRAQLGSAPDMEAVQVGTTPVVEVTAEAPTASGAKMAADTYMRAYLDFRRQAATEGVQATSRQVQSAIDGLQVQIDALSAQLRALNCAPPAGCPERTAIEQDRDARVQEQLPLRQKLSQLNIDATSTPVGTVVVPAKVPSEPTSPKPVRNGALALMLGGLLGVGLAVFHESRDDSVRDSEDVERCGRAAAVLAVIPRNPIVDEAFEPQLVTLAEPASPSAEAYRSLRTSIRFLAVDRPLRSIQVTSATHAEGKTITAANLGLVLARAGERIIMVDGDLRRPRLHEYFGMSNEVGLTSVLLDESPLPNALQKVTDDERLWLLAAGPRPPNPSDLLSSAFFSEVLGELQALASVVVIDSPPLLPVSDAAIVSGKVDGTLLVVKAGVSSRRKVTRAADLLDQIGAPMLGAVLHAASSDPAGHDGYWASGSHPVPPVGSTGARRQAAGGDRQRRRSDGSGDGQAQGAASVQWTGPEKGFTGSRRTVAQPAVRRRRKNRRP